MPKAMSSESLDHCTYIIRGWKEASTLRGKQIWRFVLLMPDSAQRQGFGEVEELCKALQGELTKIIQKTSA